MNICIATALLLALAGRAMAGDWSRETWAEEIVFQGAHAVDLQQTLDIKHHANLAEGENVFDGGWLIGARPSDRLVYAYMGGEALLHVVVTELLSRYATPWVVRGWEGLTISIDAAIIHRNASLGLRTTL